jgi:hypothetical protein
LSISSPLARFCPGIVGKNSKMQLQYLYRFCPK